MPFSIKKLTHLHRSHSTTTNNSPQSEQRSQQSQPTKSLPIDNKSTKSQQLINNDGDGEHQSKLSSKPSKSAKKLKNPQESKTSAATKQSARHPPENDDHLPQQPQPQRPPPTSSTTNDHLPLNLLYNMSPHQQQQQQNYHHQPPPSYYQASSSMVVVRRPSPSSNHSLVANLPNSRSFDHQEMYRLATNQSNVTSSQALLRNRMKLKQLQQLQQQQQGRYHSLDLDENFEFNPSSINGQQRLSSCSPPAPPQQSTAEAPSSQPLKKRVHYSNNHQQPPAANQQPTAPKPSRNTLSVGDPQMTKRTLPRQTSTTTATIATKTTMNSAINQLESKSTNAPAKSTTTTTATTTSTAAINCLPRGGEEVLINGSGYHHSRSRSYQKHSSSLSSSSASVAKHHFNKNLFTSSSIDVAVADTHHQQPPQQQQQPMNQSSTELPSRNTSKNASKSAGNTDKDKPTNDHQQNQESMNKNNKMAANISKQSQSSTGQNNYQNNQRSQSTTPIDFITDETGQLLSAAATSAAINRNLFDDDPGIMSEIETSSTGFNNRYNHRVQIPNKFRQSLPIVRTPSKSLDRSLGLVFLQFRNETKRALLPNEITSIDTVKALFVRSFPKQLSMEYLDMNLVRIYIHDSNKNMFYELEDLKDVKDRCILRIYEQNVNGPQPANGNMANLLQQQQQHIIGIQPTNPHAENYGYFSEPEFDSEYHQQQQQQQQHRKRFPSPSMLQQQQSMMTIGGGAGGAPPPQSQYYGTIMLPPQFRSATLGPRTANFFINQSTIQQQQQQQSSRNKPFQNYSQTLPRGTHLMNPQTIAAAINPFVQPPPKPQRNFLNNQPPPVPPQPADIIMIQARPIAPQAQQQQQSNPGDSQQQQQQQQSAAPTIIPYNRPLPDRPYSVAGHYPNMDRGTAAAAAGQMTRFQFPAIAANINEFSGYLSSPEHRTLPSNATLIQSIQANGQMRPSYAGHHQPTGPPPPPPPLPTYPPSAARLYHHDPAALISTATTNAIVTNPNIIVGPHRHPPLPPPHNPATINDEDARIRMQEMERKIASLTSVVSKALTNGAVGPPALPPPSANKPQPPPKPQSLINAQMNANLSQENVGQLRQIRRKARDLRQEIKQLKRFTVQQLNASREMMKENCDRIQNSLAKFNKTSDSVIRLERLRISNNCDEYNEDAQRLDHDLLELEAKVEALRSNVINRRCRVNMSNVESMALILSRASKTVADLKSRYPLLAKNLKTIMKKELNEIEKEEKFLKEEPERLEQSLKRCKKLTGTLVTLKRLASVQEQRSSSSSNHGSSSPQLLQQQQQQSKDGKKDSNFSGSGDENSSASINKSTGEQKRSTTLMNDLHHQSSKLKKRQQTWRQSSYFHRPIGFNYDHNNLKIDLFRGFSSMPTIEEPVDDEDQDTYGEERNENKESQDTKVYDNREESGLKVNRNSNDHELIIISESFDADIMEPHTIIQVTPATPSSTDSSKLTTTNILDNLLDELQTFTKQHSKERGSSRSGHNHCKIQRTLSHGTFNTCTNSNSIDDKSIINDDDDLLPNDGTIVRKASRSKSYSSIRATSEPPSGIRSKISSLTDGRIDNLDNLAMLASTCGNAAAATAALLEKRFAQSRQELLEQRHQELLYKQRQLQQQYTRLQQLSSKRSSSSSSSTTTTSNQQRSFNDNGDTNNNTAAHPGGGGGGNDTNNNNQSNTVIMEKNAAAIAASTAATNNQSAKIVHKTFETEIL